MMNHLGDWWGFYAAIIFFAGFIWLMIDTGKSRAFRSECEFRCEQKQLYYESSDVNTQECYCRPAKTKPIKIKAE